jgi:hypothetical protein
MSTITDSDGNLYKLSGSRLIDDSASEKEYTEFVSKGTSKSLENAKTFISKQKDVLEEMADSVENMYLQECEKLKNNKEFLDECFRQMDSISDEFKSYNRMRSIIFGQGHVLDKYSSDKLKKARRELERNQATYSYNIEVICKDIVGSKLYGSGPYSSYSPSSDYYYKVREYLSHLKVEDYSPNEKETALADYISKLYEDSRKIKMALGY